KAHRAEAGAVQRVEQIRIQAIEPRLALEPQIEPTRKDLVGKRQRAVPIRGEQRITEDDIRMGESIPDRLQLVDDVRDRADAMSRENAVRTIRAELGTSAAGQERNAATVGPRGKWNVMLPA